MTISIKDFEEKGTVPVRVGNGGVYTAKIMELLRSKNEAFSLAEIAKATETDMSDKTANHKLMNTLYGLRGGKKQTIIKILLKMIGDVKYYIVTPEYKDPETDAKANEVDEPDEDDDDEPEEDEEEE